MHIIKRTLISASIIGALATASFSAMADETPAVTAPVDTVVATVNGNEIMKSTFDGYMEILKKAGRANQDAAIDDLIATELALLEAEKSDILERPEIKKAIKDYTRNVLLQTWTKEKVASFNIADEEIKVAYDERVTKLASKEYNARHILVKTEDEAKAIITTLEGGADFATIAKEKSTGPSGSNGGSLGWFEAKTMVGAFAAALQDMKKGGISKTPVKTQFGYHVIKIEDTRDTKLPTLDSLKPQLERVIAQKKMLAFMKELRKTANVKITLPAPVVEKTEEEPVKAN